MWELRWILLILGLGVIAGVYWLTQRRSAKAVDIERSEPTLSDHDLGRPTPTDGSDADGPAPPTAVDRVITLRLVADKEQLLSAESIVIALRRHGLRHGKYGIFHREGKDGRQPVFSVASLVEPGSFDLSKLKDTKLPGVSLFMVLPSPGDDVSAFDDMVSTARELAQDLEIDLFDEQGSSWSFQRERYVREEIIQYRHQTGTV